MKAGSLRPSKALRFKEIRTWLGWVDRWIHVHGRQRSSHMLSRTRSPHRINEDLCFFKDEKELTDYLKSH